MKAISIIKLTFHAEIIASMVCLSCGNHRFYGYLNEESIAQIDGYKEVWGTPISDGSRIFVEKLYEIFLIHFSFCT